MKIDEHPYKPFKMNDHLWKSLNINENLWESLQQNQWKWTNTNGHTLSETNSICQTIERVSDRSERASEWVVNETLVKAMQFIQLLEHLWASQECPTVKDNSPRARAIDRAIERSERASERVSREWNSGKSNAIRITSGTFLGLTGMPDSERQLTSHRSDRASSGKPTSVAQGLILVHTDLLITDWNSL
jgi:hypothetical protein